MKIEKLRNKKSYKWFLCGLILVVVLTISYRVSKANYRISNSIELTTGKVVSSPYDFNLVSIYIDGVEQDKSIILPSTMGNYSINEEETYCYKDSKNNKDSNAKISINVLGELVIKGISKGSKCILSLNTKTEEAKTMNELLNSHYTINPNRTADNKDFNVPFDKTTYGVLYSAPNDDGTSYYFAGNPLDNWVEFGGYYWRIIRINGDGSIRMIYQGRTEDENGNRLEAQATGKETQIIVNGKNIHAFNDAYDNNKYVGYMYGEDGELRGLSNKSNAYTILNSWFANSNIKQESEYFDKIDKDAGFCGDRQPSTSMTEINGSGGSGTTTTYYGAYIRLAKESAGSVTASTATIEPTYNCIDNNDLYTYSKAKQETGNHKLENPVGMITADEAAYAGLVMNWNGANASENFLTTGSYYWTMSPFYYYDSNTYPTRIFVVGSDGYLGGGGVNNAGFGVRPTINLRKDVTFTGNGTISNPFKVTL